MKKYIIKILTLIILALILSGLSGLYKNVGLTRIKGDVGTECRKDEDYYKKHVYECLEASKTYGYPFPHRELNGISSEEYKTNWINFSKNTLFYFLLLFSITSFYEKVKILKKEDKKNK